MKKNDEDNINGETKPPYFMDNINNNESFVEITVTSNSIPITRPYLLNQETKLSRAISEGNFSISTSPKFTLLTSSPKVKRRRPSIGGALQPERVGRLFEYFIVAGLPSKGEQKEPTILYQFPDDVKLPFEVIPFCFPDEESKIEVIKKKGSNESLVHEILFARLSNLQKARNSFIFLLTNNKDVFYGICVLNYELLEMTPSFIDPKSIYYSFPSNSLQENSKVFKTPRIYCFISKFPFFRLHFNVLYTILARERLYGIENFFGENKTPEGTLKLSVQENENITLLKAYYNQAIPQAGQDVKFELPGRVNILDFHCPKEDNDTLVSEWCLPSAFRILTLDQILLLLRYAMLEKHIIILCSNVGVLSSIVLSVIPLLRPYVWQCPLIPILPSSLFEYLQAPVPFIAGITRLPEGNTFDALIIDVDKEKVIKPKEVIPPLPEKKTLKSNLKHYHEFLHTCTADRYHDPFNTNSKQLEAVQNIMIELRKYHQRFLQIFTPYLRADMDLSDSKTCDSVIEKISKSEVKKFIQSFLNTQLFTAYFQELFSILTDEKEQTKKMSLEVQRKIQLIREEQAQALKQIEIQKKIVSDCEDQIRALVSLQESLDGSYHQLVKVSVNELSKSYLTTFETK